MSNGKMTWFEVPAEDAERARAFYGELFGWQFQAFDEAGDYQVTEEGAVSSSDRKGLLLYFSTSDIDASVSQVGELGGSASEPGGIPGVGRYATCTDIEGNAFGLFEPDRSS
jgi:predicted enzyme related to lactoylglutathione lyase